MKVKQFVDVEERIKDKSANKPNHLLSYLSTYLSEKLLIYVLVEGLIILHEIIVQKRDKNRIVDAIKVS